MSTRPQSVHDFDAWRDEVRAFVRDHVPQELVDEVWAGAHNGPGHLEHVFEHEVAKRGWYGLTLPEEFGGCNLTAQHLFILIDELEYVGAPLLDMTVSSIGPTINRFGTPENKAEWLPKLVRREVKFALGYSEPDAGTDLASLRTQAVLDGDEWVVNGQKIWNSGAHKCSHEWLCVRTTPGSTGHRGLSILVVPIDAPGVEVNALWTWGDYRTNQTFFSEVRVPRGNLIGEEGQGWRYIVGALALERCGMGTSGDLRRLFDGLVQFCTTTRQDGALLAARPEVRAKLAELAMDLEVCRLFGVATAVRINAGDDPMKQATMQKVFKTELRTKLTDWALQIAGLRGQLNHADPLALVRGEVERAYRRAPYLRFGGGTNEVMRDIIAQRYGLPRSR